MFRSTYLYVKTHNKTGMRYFGKTVMKNPHLYKGSGTRWLRHLSVHGCDISTEIVGFFTDESECKAAAELFSESNNIVESPLWANLISEAGVGCQNPSIMSRAERSSRMKNANPMHILANKEKHKVSVNTDEYTTRASLRSRGESNPNFGNTGPNGHKHSTETRLKISERMLKDNPMSRIDVKIKHQIAQQNPLYRTQTSLRMKENNPACRADVKAKISLTVRAQPKITCVHCLRDFDCRNYARYHGDKCKSK